MSTVSKPSSTESFSYTEQKRPRKDFSKLQNQLKVPGLLTIQLKSYNEQFLQKGVQDDKKADIGLHAAFKSVFPIIAHSGDKIEYAGFRLGLPAFSVRECQIRGLTYAGALRVRVRLIIYDK